MQHIQQGEEGTGSELNLLAEAKVSRLGL